MSDDTNSEPGDDAGARTTAATRWWLLGAAALAVVGVIVLLLFVRGDDDDAISLTDSSTSSTTVQTTDVSASSVPPETTDAANTTAESTTTVAASTTTIAPGPTTTTTTTTTTATTTTSAVVVTTTLPVPELDIGIWPAPGSDLRFDDPVAAVASFALDFIEFDDPTIGVFQAGDARSGEVEVRPFDGGPVTVVFVRQLGTNGTWSVIGAATESIVVDQPETLSVIGTPVTVSGAARAFEGTVYVEIRVDGEGDDAPIFEGFVTGSGGPELGDFEETFTWEQPNGGAGSMVFLSVSSEDDSVLEAGAIRVFFSEVP